MDIKFELKKCPFCGGEAQMIVAQADIKLYGIECKKCHILMGHTVNNSTEFFRKPIYAADAWNQRAETAAGQCEVVIDAKAWDELPAEVKEKMMKALRGTMLRVVASDMGHLPATKCNIPMPEVKPCKEHEEKWK